MSEQVIEVDENDSPIGLRPKEDFLTGKYIHRSSHLILFANYNEILIQKRSPEKKWYPDLYTFSVSGTNGDEEYQECIERETPEEIGIKVPVKFLFKFYLADKFEKAFHGIFVGKSNEMIKPDYREMSEIKYVPAGMLKEDIKKRPEIYTPVFVKGMTKFFEEFCKL